ncbi:thioredoxin-dependent thiol peroxidase [bacterium I07]|nr:thioredoxin-dependent thiol peroxidase [bacterium I07]
MSVKIGDRAPEFCLPDSDEQEICMKNLQGKWIVLYFYPKDNTSGCTLEAIDFTKQMNSFKSLNCDIIGVSPDSPKSHCNFRDKHEIGIQLLSDPSHKVIKAFGCWVKKKMYGREYYGVERSTFLIDPFGIVQHEWRKVKVKEHVETVEDKLKQLQ